MSRNLLEKSLFCNLLKLKLSQSILNNDLTSNIDCDGGDGDNCNENDHGTLRNILIISSMTMMLIMIMMIYLAATVSRTL